MIGGTTKMLVITMTGGRLVTMRGGRGGNTIMLVPSDRGRLPGSGGGGGCGCPPGGLGVAPFRMEMPKADERFGIGKTRVFVAVGTKTTP